MCFICFCFLYYRNSICVYVCVCASASACVRVFGNVWYVYAFSFHSKNIDSLYTVGIPGQYLFVNIFNFMFSVNKYLYYTKFVVILNILVFCKTSLKLTRFWSSRFEKLVFWKTRIFKTRTRIFSVWNLRRTGRNTSPILAGVKIHEHFIQASIYGAFFLNDKQNRT